MAELKKFNFRDNVNPVFECVKRTAADAGVAYRDPFEQGRFGYAVGSFARGAVNVVRARHIFEARNALVESARIRLGLSKAAYLKAFIGKDNWTDDVSNASQLMVLPEKNIWYEELERACGEGSRETPPFSGFQALSIQPQFCIEYGQGDTGSSQHIQFKRQLLAEVTVAHFVKGMVMKKVVFASGFPPGIGPFTLYTPGPDLKRGIFIAFLISVVYAPVLQEDQPLKGEYFFFPTGDVLLGTTNYVYEAGTDMYTDQGFSKKVKAPLVKDRDFLIFRFRIGVVSYDNARLAGRTPADPYPNTSIICGDDQFLPGQKTKVELIFTGKPATAVADLKAELGSSVKALAAALSKLCKDSTIASLRVVKITGPAFMLRCTPLSTNFQVYVENRSNNTYQYNKVTLVFSILVNGEGTTPPEGTIEVQGGFLGGNIGPNSVSFINVPVRYNPIVGQIDADGNLTFKTLRFPPGTTALFVRATVHISGVNNSMVTASGFSGPDTGPARFEIRDDSACEETASLGLVMTFTVNGGPTAQVSAKENLIFSVSIFNPNKVAVGGTVSFGSARFTSSAYVSSIVPQGGQFGVPAQTTTEIFRFAWRVADDPPDDSGSMMASFTYQLGGTAGNSTETVAGIVNWRVTATRKEPPPPPGTSIVIRSSSASPGTIYLGSSSTQAHTTELTYYIDNGLNDGVTLSNFVPEIKDTTGRNVTGQFKINQGEKANGLFIPAQTFGRTYIIDLSVRTELDPSGKPTDTSGVFIIDASASGVDSTGKSHNMDKVQSPGSFSVARSAPLSASMGVTSPVKRLNAFKSFTSLGKPGLNALLVEAVGKVSAGALMFCGRLLFERVPQDPLPSAGAASASGRHPIGMEFGNGESAFWTSTRTFGTIFRRRFIPSQYLDPNGPIELEPIVSPSRDLKGSYLLSPHAADPLKVPFNMKAEAELLLVNGNQSTVDVRAQSTSPHQVEIIQDTDAVLGVITCNKSEAVNSDVEILVPGTYLITLYGSPFFYGGSGSNGFFGVLFDFFINRAPGGQLFGYRPYVSIVRELNSADGLNGFRKIGPITGTAEGAVQGDMETIQYRISVNEGLFPAPTTQTRPKVVVQVSARNIAGVLPTGLSSIKVEREGDANNQVVVTSIGGPGFFRDEDIYLIASDANPGVVRRYVAFNENREPRADDFGSDILTSRRYKGVPVPFSFFLRAPIYGMGFAGVAWRAFGNTDVAKAEGTGTPYSGGSTTHLFLLVTGKSGASYVYGTAPITNTRPDGTRFNYYNTNVKRTIVNDCQINVSFGIDPNQAVREITGNKDSALSPQDMQLVIYVDYDHPPRPTTAFTQQWQPAVRISWP